MADRELIQRAAVEMLCGDLLGEGSDRLVYAHRFAGSLVVKVEKHGLPDDFANRQEWAQWNAFTDRQSLMFAPCLAISSCGMILIQKRTMPIYDLAGYPEKLPAYITDNKPANFGMCEGRFVCHDYADLRWSRGETMLPVNWSPARIPVKGFPNVQFSPR